MDLPLGERQAWLRPAITGNQTPDGFPNAGTTAWVQTRPGLPYFVTETGSPWTPVGQNDAIDWVELRDLFRRRDLPGVEAHLRWLRASGVNCLRLMLEYAHRRHRYIERPVGRFVPDMVRLWDDLFRLCEEIGLKILLTPFDTFWTWLQWKHHPYNVLNGGPLRRPSEFLLSPATRAAIKARLGFAVERWGGSHALFAWDLWNEIHPAQAGGSADCFGEFIQDLSHNVRRLETRLYGRAHPQTVSLFGPELWWRPEMELREPIFRHPDLDFASIHLYHQGTIDAPDNTVDPAISTGRIVREAIAEIRDGRPFLDTEHGPIHTFKDKRRSLPEAFDDEYFRHMQWAHLASGGAGGGMRWPNRKPHVLTRGMREAQRALSDFLPLVDWTSFRRKNLNREIRALSSDIAVFGCADERQAVIWLLRRNTIGADGLLRKDVAPTSTTIRIPGLAAGTYAATGWNTTDGAMAWNQEVSTEAALMLNVPPFAADIAIAVRPV
ncbi:hypothetical protein [uncultured Enterovirga sp.]|uniref:hypothetical protein n=1 Tax=uncultured Enterovirga sp. TaxID=2026352 RepID=UPI0035CAFD13